MSDKGESTVLTPQETPLPRTRGLRPPWKKGQSGNPRGRPKNIVSEAYRKYLQARAPEAVRAKLEAKGYRVRTGAEAIAVGQLQAAMRGSAPCAKELREAAEGKVADRVQLADAEGKPTQFVITHLIPGAYSDPRK